MNRVCSIFSQILSLIPRRVFDDAVKKHQAERHARGFTSRAQIIAMLYCQLGHAQSLREITGGLAACEGKLRHLGVEEPPARSTLGYANEHRPWQMYQTLFNNLLTRCQAEATGLKRKFRFKHKLLSLDSTVIPLCLSVFDWASVQAGQRRRETAHGARSRWLFARLRRAERWQDGRHHGSQGNDIRRRNHVVFDPGPPSWCR